MRRRVEGKRGQRAAARHPDRERNVAERFRRAATRYETETANLLAFAWVAAVMVMSREPGRRSPLTSCPHHLVRSGDP